MWVFFIILRTLGIFTVFIDIPVLPLQPSRIGVSVLLYMRSEMN